jgi:hypothetical protein
MNVVFKKVSLIEQQSCFYSRELTVGNKGTIYPGTGHEPRRWMGVSGQSRATAVLPPGKRAGTHSR